MFLFKQEATRCFKKQNKNIKNTQKWIQFKKFLTLRAIYIAIYLVNTIVWIYDYCTFHIINTTAFSESHIVACHVIGTTWNELKRYLGCKVKRRKCIKGKYIYVVEARSFWVCEHTKPAIRLKKKNPNQTNWEKRKGKSMLAQML